MKRFEPLMTYSPPSSRASVRIAAESDPEPASVSAYAGSHSPLARRGSQRAFCSTVPASLIPSEPSSCTASSSPVVAQTLESSSIATSTISAPVPVPPCSSSNGRPKSSCSRSSSTMSQGNWADLSISAARGATRSRASVRTRSRISRCSSVSGSTAMPWSLVFASPRLATVVEDRLDVVAVGVEHVGAVVAGVILGPLAGRAVVPVARRQRDAVELVHRAGVRCREREVDVLCQRPRGRPVGRRRRERERGDAAAKVGPLVLTQPQPEPEHGRDRLVERDRSVHIADAQPEVVDTASVLAEVVLVHGLDAV